MSEQTAAEPQLSLGVMARSLKENERRLALHPAHLPRIPEELRERIYLEHGYGAAFGSSDADLAPLVGGLLGREQLIAECDVVVQPKPMLADIEALRPGQAFWGWPHCVQDRQLTQLAIDKRLTLMAFEAMNHWRRDGSFGVHVFHANNEMAGYCSVLHAMALAGLTGDYGPRLRAVVVGFGATARGAVTALSSLGVHDINVLTHRQVAAVAAPIHSATLVHFDPDEPTARASHALTETGRQPVGRFLAAHDIVVNCVLQDTDAREVYMTEEDLAYMAPGGLVVDVSCDEGMGFSWARPTSFAEPMFEVGDHIRYYGVDHTPSYLWDSASWEVSEALLPFLETVMSGPAAWALDEPIDHAIEIHDGVIINPAILEFQERSATYPHHGVK